MTDDDIRAAHLRQRDFLGAFAVVTRKDAVLMVQNQRTIGGRSVAVWDLPGGQVEDGESLTDTLGRELREETGLAVAGQPRFLFVQEGERLIAGRRTYVWRSFFFACDATGEPAAGGEVLAVQWCPRATLARLLTAPYHDSFAQWLHDHGSYYRSAWRD